MAMHWDLTGIKNHEKLCFITKKDEKTGEEYQALHPMTYVLTIAAMSTGIPTITEENWEEFFLRVEIMQKNLNYGFLLTSKGRTFYIKAKDIKNHIGMKTWSQFHGGPDEKRSAWIKRVLGHRAFELAISELERQTKPRAKKEVKHG